MEGAPKQMQKSSKKRHNTFTISIDKFLRHIIFQINYYLE